jgi:hypothetical protein
LIPLAIEKRQGLGVLDACQLKALLAAFTSVAKFGSFVR